ncbi:MAG TPA: hypothetical protein VF388_05485 [Lacunisphaera sp.]
MILRGVPGYGGLAVGIGLLVGLALTFVINKLLFALLAGGTARDPWVVVAGVMVLNAIALMACRLPDRGSAPRVAGCQQEFRCYL